MEFSRHSCIMAHKAKVCAMACDQTRKWLYSVGADRKMFIIDLH